MVDCGYREQEDERNAEAYEMHIPGAVTGIVDTIEQHKCCYCPTEASDVKLRSNVCLVRQTLFRKGCHVAKDPLNMDAMECAYCDATGERLALENEHCPKRERRHTPVPVSRDEWGCSNCSTPPQPTRRKLIDSGQCMPIMALPPTQQKAIATPPAQTL